MKREMLRYMKRLGLSEERYQEKVHIRVYGKHLSIYEHGVTLVGVHETLDSEQPWSLRVGLGDAVLYATGLHELEVLTLVAMYEHDPASVFKTSVGKLYSKSAIDKLWQIKVEREEKGWHRGN